MAVRVSPPRALVALAACGAMACGLSSSGLGADLDPGAGTSTPGSGAGTVELVDAGSESGTIDSSAAVAADDDAPTTEGVEGTDAAGPPAPDSAPPDLSAEAGDSCDQDGDGFRAAGACGGDDCCDLDARAHPGQTAFFTLEDACGAFDYNCDGQAEEEFDAAKCQLGLLTCTGSGFDKTAPPCGGAGTFDTCDYEILFCGTSQSNVTQACR